MPRKIFTVALSFCRLIFPQC